MNSYHLCYLQEHQSYRNSRQTRFSWNRNLLELIYKMTPSSSYDPRNLSVQELQAIHPNPSIVERTNDWSQVPPPDTGAKFKSVKIRIFFRTSWIGTRSSRCLLRQLVPPVEIRTRDSIRESLDYESVPTYVGGRDTGRCLRGVTHFTLESY